MRSAAKFGLFLAAVLAIGGVAVILFVVANQRALQQPLNVGPTPIVYQIKPGMTLQQVVGDLDARHVLAHPFYVLLYARLHGLSRRIKAGEYALRPGMTPVDMVRLFVSGKVFERSLTLVEGWTFQEMMSAVQANPYLDHTLNGLDRAAIMRRLGHPGVNPEGMFFPDTYHFPRGTTDVAFLERAYTTMQRHLHTQWEHRAKGLPLSDPYQALILASIIEKETAVPSERARIAGVFVRRLEKGMRLETDPTVIYGLGASYQGRLTRADLARDTPYNTYLHKGLPPTPIANPGLASIHAALHPVIDGSLYFVARGDGTHQFSRTYQGQLRAIRRYLLNSGRHSDDATASP